MRSKKRKQTTSAGSNKAALVSAVAVAARHAIPCTVALAARPCVTNVASGATGVDAFTVLHAAFPKLNMVAGDAPRDYERLDEEHAVQHHA